MDFRATLAGLCQQLDTRGVSWAVIGAVAMGFWGVARATFDVDLLVEYEHLDGLDLAMEALRCRLEYRWDESSHYMPEGDQCCPVDVLHARRPHSRSMLKRAKRCLVDPPGIQVPVVQLEDLIGLKVQALVNDPERERMELVDIRALLEEAAFRREKIDLARIREYFAIFGRERTLEELMRGLEDAFA